MELLLTLLLASFALATPVLHPKGPTPTYVPSPKYYRTHEYYPTYTPVTSFVPATYKHKHVPSYETVPSYNYDWSVKDPYSGSNYGHRESRNGYGTQGSYSVRLPDGRTQRVTYTVTKDSGFVAKVTYEGEAKYPLHQHKYESKSETYNGPSHKPVLTYKPTPAHKPTFTYNPLPSYEVSFPYRLTPAYRFARSSDS